LFGKDFEKKKIDEIYEIENNLMKFDENKIQDIFKKVFNFANDLE